MSKLFKVFEQTSWQVLGKIVSSFSTIVILAIISRHFTQSQVGIYTQAVTYLAFFYLSVDLGLNAYFLPQLKDQPLLGSKILSLRIYLSLILMVLAIVLTFILPFNSLEFSLAIIFGAITILFSGVFNSCNLIFQANLRYNRAIIASSVGTLFLIPLIWFFSQNNFPISFLFLGLTLSWGLIAFLAILLVKPYQHFSLRKWDQPFFSKVIFSAWPISLTLLLNVVYFRVDSFLIAFFRGFAEVGIYNFAFQFFQTALVIPTFIMNSFYPMMIESFNKNKSLFVSQIKTAFIFLFGLSILGIILTFLLSPILINLVGGPNFLFSIEPLNILSLSFPAFFLSSLMMWVMVTLRLYKKMAAIYLIGLLINLVLNFIFIPQYSYIASSWVTVFCEYLILILQIVILVKEFKKL